MSTESPTSVNTPSDGDVSDQKPLTPRQARFVEEYIKDLNGSHAAIRAGYAADSNGEGARLLAHARVKEAIDRALVIRSARVNVQADEVIQELHLLATSCVEHYILDDFGQLRPAPDAPEGVMRAVKSINRKVRRIAGRNGEPDTIEYDVKFELWDKPGQLKLLGRHAGVKSMFDRVEHSGIDGKPIETVTRIERVIVKAPDGTNA